jgi:hypothetical protein
MRKNSAAVSLGRFGGRKTADRGSEHVRKISSLRERKAGGRPQAYLGNASELLPY